MSLATQVRPLFPPEVQARGWQYFQSRQVELLSVGNKKVRARVRGTAVYAARIELTRDGWELYCTCPVWVREGHCRHLWAAVLEADRFRAERGLDEPEASELVPDLDERWRDRLQSLAERADERHEALLGESQPIVEERIGYLLDVDASVEAERVCLTLVSQRRTPAGGWGERRMLVASRTTAMRADEADRRILLALRGADAEDRGTTAGSSRDAARYALDEEQLELVLPWLAETGRWHLYHDGEIASAPLAWSPEPPLHMVVRLRHDEESEQVLLEGRLRSGDDEVGTDAAGVVLLPERLVVWKDTVRRLAPGESEGWVEELLSEGPIVAPLDSEPELLESLLALPALPRLELPGLEERSGIEPRPRLSIRGTEADRAWSLSCRIAFEYDGVEVGLGTSGVAVLGPGGGWYVVRDRDEELRRLREIGAVPGVRLTLSDTSQDAAVSPARLSPVVRELVQRGWWVEADGRRYRSSGGMSLAVASGIDWFELTGAMDFDGEEVALPDLLAAARSGAATVRLGDGSVGVLPEDWMESWGLLADLGEQKDGAVRFGQNQGWLLDALLAEREQVRTDAGFEEHRARLREFTGIEAVQEPDEFQGTLRDYQREGLGWMRFLERVGWGGCLADDMGLGKTVQVLALLQQRKLEGDRQGPALVVAPRSVVFNWMDEAARFTPDLVVLDYTGPERADVLERFPDADVIVTTYGILRRDVVGLRETVFDYLILDEAQFVKNSASQTSKASRVLEGRHRLALSGTPIENRLEELWSLFEFLNPGMLGRSSAFQRVAKGRRASGEGGEALLGAALRPFLLRRTKEQVAKDLPPKTEQTLSCELPRTQRRLYDQLRRHYRTALLRRADDDGVKRIKIQVLEALLRLRQAACHPGLVDAARKGEPAAKLDALVPLLHEVVEGGHKALVFSQFTSMLALVKERLDSEGLRYSYLDGATRDRRGAVSTFQKDPDCPLFLISLKAGGLGLNLTAADYVFLLDPWWNPAAEAQAIDRTYRIGQTRKVMAYRLICRDTVEERIQELQQKKRALFDTLLTDRNAVLSELTREDLELLLR